MLLKVGRCNEVHDEWNNLTEWPINALHLPWACSQWRSEAKCLLGPTIKKLPFPLVKFVYKNLKCKIMFLGYKRYKWQSNTHKLQWVLFFIVNLCFPVFMPVATFIVITPIFFFLICICIRHNSSNIFRVDLWYPASRTVDFCHLFQSYPTCGVGQEFFTVHGHVLLKFSMFCKLNTLT